MKRLIPAALLLLLFAALVLGQHSGSTGDVKTNPTMYATSVNATNPGDTYAELTLSGARTTTGGHASRMRFCAPSSPAGVNAKNFMFVNTNAGTAGGENILRIRSVNDDCSGTKADIMAFEQNTRDVGIGTTAPERRLHVVGSVMIVDGTQGAGRVFTSDANGVGSWSAAGTTSSGEFTPTCTASFNVQQCSINTGSWRYIRVGNTVQVFGRLIVRSTTAGDLSAGKISLPVASDFTDTQDASGGGGRFLNDSTTPAAQFHVSADSIDNNITLYWVHTDATNWEGHVVFSYIVK